MAKKVAKKVTTDTVQVPKEEMVEVQPTFELGVAGKKYYPGVKYVVEKHLGQTLLHMSELKRNAELSIFVGKKYEIERLLTPTGYRVIRKEVGSVA